MYLREKGEIDSQRKFPRKFPSTVSFPDRLRRQRLGGAQSWTTEVPFLVGGKNQITGAVSLLQTTALPQSLHWQETSQELQPSTPLRDAGNI